MTNDTMTKECPMPNAQAPRANIGQSGLGHWSLELGHSLVIGHWSLVILQGSLVIRQRLLSAA